MKSRVGFRKHVLSASYTGVFGNQSKELKVKSGETLKFEVVIEKPQ